MGQRVVWVKVSKNSIRDARTPQPGKIFLTPVQSSGYFQSSVSYIKVQIMLK